MQTRIRFCLAFAVLVITAHGQSSICRTLANQELPASDDKSIREVVESYIKSGFDQRYKYVIDGSKLKEQMEKHYAAIIPRTIESVEIQQVKKIKDGLVIVTAVVKAGNIIQRMYPYARKVKGIWLIDWPATAGANSISLKTFRAIAPKEITKLRVIAELTNYYNFQYLNARKTHYSIRLFDTRNGFINGFAKKDSKAGKELFEILKDGNRHQISVAVQCTGENGSVAEIVALLSKSWLLK